MSDTEDEQLCPLCMEGLDETDKSFSPCGCGYQVCLWCLHYLRTSMGDKCPACRRPYDESKFQFTGQIPAINQPTNRTKKPPQPPQQPTYTPQPAPAPLQNGHPNTSFEELKNMRVLQRNLVYVVGLPQRVAKKEILKRPEYFGQYGKIQHVVVNRSQAYSAHWEGPSYSVYVTYSKVSEATAAIEGVDGSQIDNRVLRASFGTTKYCVYFLKNVKCTNVDCFYLHQLGDEKDTFSREEMIPARHQLHGLVYQKPDATSSNSQGSPKIFGVIHPHEVHEQPAKEEVERDAGDIYDVVSTNALLDSLINIYNRGENFLVVTDVTKELISQLSPDLEDKQIQSEEDLVKITTGLAYKWNLEKISNINTQDTDTKSTDSKLDSEFEKYKAERKNEENQMINHLNQLYLS